jgi:hypothetical protein
MLLHRCFWSVHGLSIFASVQRDTCAAKKVCKFEAELPNGLWQSDVMDGPKVDVNSNMRKSYLIMESARGCLISALCQSWG